MFRNRTLSVPTLHKQSRCNVEKKSRYSVTISSPAKTETATRLVEILGVLIPRSSRTSRFVGL